MKLNGRQQGLNNEKSINRFSLNQQYKRESVCYFNYVRIIEIICYYIFIPLLLFGCIGCRIDCRSLSYCSLNHWLRGIRFAVRVSSLSLSRRICRGVLSVANHRLCSEENSRPIKFPTLNQLGKLHSRKSYLLGEAFQS